MVDKNSIMSAILEIRTYHEVKLVHSEISSEKYLERMAFLDELEREIRSS